MKIITKKQELKEQLEKNKQEKNYKEIFQMNMDFQIANANKQKEIEYLKEEIQEYIQEIQETKKNRIENLENVAKAKGQLEELCIGVEGTDSAIHELSSFLEETSASTQESASSITQIEKNIDAIKNSIIELDNTADNSIINIDTLLDKVTLIQKDSKYIEEIMKLIIDINERIHLLSMNALIEAAHAGKEGKGFQIVANEIRALSESTSAQIKNVKNNIKSTLKNIVDSSNASDNVKKNIHYIKNQVVAEKEAIIEISSAVNQQAISTQQISNSIFGKTENLCDIKEVLEDIVTQVNECTNKMKKLGVENE